MTATSQATDLAALQGRPGRRRALFLSTTPAAPSLQRLTAVLCLVSLIGFVPAAIFAPNPLPHLPSFVAISETALVTFDIATATLLYGQFRILRTVPLLVLACGYLFAALMTGAHLLTFPGVFATDGLLKAGPQSASWLYVFWRCGFLLALMAYALPWNGGRPLPSPIGSLGVAAILATIGAAGALALLATHGEPWLPELMTSESQFTPGAFPLSALVCGLTALTLLLLGRRRPRTVLDLALMSVTWACLLEVLLGVILNNARFTVGFYSGRAFGFLAGGLVLFVLMSKADQLYRHEVALATRLDRELRQRLHAEARLREANHALSDSKQRLEAAAAAGVVGLWDYDIASGKVAWDSVMRQLYGFGDADFDGSINQIFGRIHPEDRPRVVDAFCAAVARGAWINVDFRIVLADGTTRNLRKFAKPTLGPDGRPIRVLGVTYDVTEQTNALNALAEAKAQADAARAEAEAANKAKSDFIANISHEIRTPLNAIVGMIELLARGARDAEQAGYVRTLETSARSMLVLLTDILDLAKIEAGQLELNEIPFALGDLVDDVVDTFAALAKRKGVALISAPTGALPILLGDATRVSQVLINLVGNALKFTLEGSVTVSFEALESSATSVRVRVVVRDTGIGIAPEHIEKLFEPFAQAEAATAMTFGGTGLGLAISKQLIASMGGEIGVESEKGKGSAFWFVVAFETTAAPVAEAARAADGPGVRPLDGVRVLVVDDIDTNREVAVKLLALEGAICDVATNGREAIERIQAGPDGYDIVLMDVQMPEMDGIEATRFLRKELGLVDLPIIALTAGATAGQRELALAAEMNGFVAKPFRLKDLVAALSPWVRRRPIGRPAGD